MSTKSSNPKEAVGSSKLPLSLVPATAMSYAALAHLDGALKYGAWNWREAGARASIYVDAAMRHLEKWNNGEEFDRDSGVHHLGHVLACINILIDAQLANVLTDDRPPRANGLSQLMDKMTEDVAVLRKRHHDKNPKHYTIKDSNNEQGKEHLHRDQPSRPDPRGGYQSGAGYSDRRESVPLGPDREASGNY